MKRYLLSVALISSFAAVTAEQAPTEAPAIDSIAATGQEVIKSFQEKLFAYAKKSLGSGSHLFELAAGCYFAKLLHDDFKGVAGLSGGWQMKLLFALATASFLKNSTEGLNDKLQLQLGQKLDTLATLVKRKIGMSKK